MIARSFFKYLVKQKCIRFGEKAKIKKGNPPPKKKKTTKNQKPKQNKTITTKETHTKKTKTQPYWRMYSFIFIFQTKQSQMLCF